MRKVLIITFLSIFCFGAYSQQLILTLEDSSEETFLLPDIQSIKFENDSMVLREQTQATHKWSILDIAHYSFSDELSSDKNILDKGFALKIFPNPSTDVVNIKYHSEYVTTITIDITDLSGKVIHNIFQGNHQGERIYEWNSNVQKGTYLIRFTNNKGDVFTKPVIII